jgi:hypothetical protein
VARVLPRISEEGRDYLEKIARALFLLQSPAVMPLAGEKTEMDTKEPAENSHSRS